jgi:hypothetical protein
MVRVAAGMVIAWFAWQLVSASILSQVNLSLQVRSLQEALKQYQAHGQSVAPPQ